MQVESIAGALCNTLDLQLATIGLENQCSVLFESGCLTQVLLHIILLTLSVLN